MRNRRTLRPAPYQTESETFRRLNYMAAAPPTSHRIFVSHSSKDNEFGVRLVQDLRRKLGSEDAVWYDSHGGLFGGDSWWETIKKELTARHVFMVVLSPDALASKWV